MGNLQKIYAIAQYEWTRALARKKVSLLMILTIMAEFLLYLILTQLPLPAPLRNLQSFLWLVGIIFPHGLLLHFIAIFIGTGATAEEYEQGTADSILSKPVRRADYLIGKFLGGYTLVGFTALLTSSLAVALSYISFGSQAFAEYAPAIYLAIVFSTLVFFSIGFMTGEVFRASSIAYIASSSIFISSQILSPVLVLASNLTGDRLYLQVMMALPTWGSLNLPMMVARALFLQDSQIPFGFGDLLAVGGTISQAVLSISIYAIVPITITLLHFLRSDIANKTAS